MTNAEAWDLIIKAAGLFGGISVVSVAVAAFLAKFFSDRSIEKHKAELGKETETHKLKLKKKEILFSKQLDAIGAFIELHQKLRPGFDWPEKDWGEACSEVVDDFGKFENRLEEYLRHFGAAISKDVREMIKSCVMLASINKFARAGEQYGDMKQAEKAAGEVLETLEKIEQKMLDELEN